MRAEQFCAAMVEALCLHLDEGANFSLPAGGEMIWAWFVDLSAGRGWRGGAPVALQWSEIAAYCRVLGHPIEPRHVEILRAMDLAYLRHMARQQPKAGAQEAAKPVSRTKLTGGLFDAMFGGS